jgi:hypothetical protein
MKTVISIILPLFMIFQVTVNAQEVVATGGDYFSNSYGSLSYTLGETVIETFTKPAYTLTQGFQQSLLVESFSDSTNKSNIVVIANPNPARHLVKVNIENAGKEKLTYVLSGLSGDLLLTAQFEPPETEIPVGSLPPSIYILKIYSGNEEVKSFKIIKQ